MNPALLVPTMLVVPTMLAAMLAIGGCGAIAVTGADRGGAAQPTVAELAAEGDAEAQLALGWMHEIGRAVTKNPAAAARWYGKAADQGNALAQFYLAEMYARGAGVPADAVEAVAWYRKSAEQDNALAQLRLGRLYERGVGVTQDYATAAQWYARARRLWRAQTSHPPGAERIVGPLPAPVVLTRPAPEYASLGANLMVVDRTPPAGSLGAAMATWKARRQSAGGVEYDEPADGRAGGRSDGLWVHVASFRAPARAVRYRDEIRKRHNDLLGGLQVRLTPIDLGADRGMWVRVRAGPIADMRAAAALCRGLRVRNIYCAPLPP